MSLPRYPAYKDSGVPWLGEVPAHWGVTVLKRLVDMKSGEAITSEEIESEGPFAVYGGNGLRGFTSRSTHNGEYVLVGRQGALCGNINYASGQFWASEHAVVCTPIQKVVTRWLGELLRAMNLGQYSVAAAQPGLSVEAIAALRVPLPPLAEQEAIAAFLDRETARVDALVAEQGRLIALLKEKRQAVISHAVTRGLNPDAPRKPSGVAWLGEVPAHWEVKPLKRVSPQLTVGIVVEPSRYYAAEGVPALRSLNVGRGRILTDSMVFITQAGHVAHSKSRLSAGDLVAVRSGQPGTTAVVPEELDGCNCIDLIVIRRPTGGSEHYLSWCLGSDMALHQFSMGTDGAIQQHFNVTTAESLLVTQPPLAEQKAIVDFLDRETAAIDALIAEAERAIALLGERRAALIAAAVTGRVDVRGVAAGEGV